MKRRSRAGGNPTKGRRRKVPGPKRRAPKAGARSNSSSGGEETEIARLTRELSEALERQAATSEVLQVISGSPGDLQPVFAAMLENAVRICDAKFGNIHRWDGDALHLMATHNTPHAFAEYRRRSLWRPHPTNAVGRAIATKTVVQVADIAAEQAYTEQRNPSYVAAVELGGIRTLLAVPMLKESELIGVFTVYRQEVRPFNDKQIALITSFASQAVIAIENARLLNELRQSLEQQTATSDVLRVISLSPGELDPVFQAMLGNALRICEAKFGGLFRLQDDSVRLAASLGTPEPLVEFFKSIPRRPYEDGPIMRAIRTKTPMQVADLAAELAYVERGPIAVAGVELGGIRSLLVVPMLTEGEVIGLFAIFRQEVRPFTDEQIALVKNFAAQAVIAIENARLLNELRQSLEQQTATSEVLQVISSSPGELEPVFSTMVEKAVRICGAKFGTLYVHEGGGLRLVAGHDVPEFLEARGSSPIQPAPGGGLELVMKTKRTVHIDDLAATQSYAERNPRMVEAVEIAGIRTVVAVPMLKDDDLVGVIAVHRREVHPFTDKQIALVENFAAQAVIAIENTRLLNELRQRTDDLTERTTDLTEALEQQTATSEVLQTISSSPGDLEPVFAAMLEKAVRICDAKFGNIYRRDGDVFRLLATHNTPPGLAEHRRRSPIRFDPTTLFGRMMAAKCVVHVADLAEEEGYIERVPETVSAVELGGIRTVLAVPMLKEDELGSNSLNPPYKSGGEADRGQVILRQPVVSGCDAPEVLQSVERTLDAPT